MMNIAPYTRLMAMMMVMGMMVSMMKGIFIEEPKPAAKGFSPTQQGRTVTLYHVTEEENVASIMRRGLLSPVHMHTSEITAHSWRSGMAEYKPAVVLRVELPSSWPIEDDPEHPPEVAVVSNKDIPSGYITISPLDRVKIMYYSATEGELSDILNEGIRPKIIAQTSEIGIYLSPSMEHLDVSTLFGLSVLWDVVEAGLAEKAPVLFVLEVTLPADTYLEPDRKFKIGSQYGGYVTHTAIPPQHIRVIEKLEASDFTFDRPGETKGFSSSRIPEGSTTSLTDKMKTMYHSTSERYLPAILNEGLTPQPITGPTGIGTSKRGIYLSPSREDLEVFVTFGLNVARHIARDIGRDLKKVPAHVVLEVTIPADTPMDPDPEYKIGDRYGGYIVYTAIPPQHIRVIERLEVTSVGSRRKYLGV